MSLYRFRHLHLRTGTGVLVVAATVAATGIFPVFPAAAQSPTERVIIELEGDPAVDRVGQRRATDLRAGDKDARAEALKAYRAATEAIHAAQKDVIGAATSSGIAVSNPRYITGVLNAVIADVDPSNIDSLRDAPGVARVTVDTRIGLMTGADGEPEPDTAAPTATPAATPTATPEPTSDASLPTEPPTSAPENSAATQTAPAPAAAQGEGTTVAVLDTGIDYSLADLGAGFGDGFKVVDGYDFVNDDADPMDDHYHGTHVAGIIAGTGAESVTGVAPAANLTAYKVLDGGGEGYISVILAGMEAAADPTGDHPADVINMSLGGSGDGRDVLGVAAGNISKAGTLVVAAAGNAGPDEATIGTPAAADGVLAVGASITDFRIATARIVAPLERDVVSWRVIFSATPPAEPVTAPVIDVGTGTVEDFDRVGDVTGKVVVYRGLAPRGIKDEWGDSLLTARLAESRGAVAALVYQHSELDQNNGGGGSPSSSGAEAGIVDVSPSSAGALDSGDDARMDKLVVFGITASEYAIFSSAVAEGTARLTLSSEDATDRMASFSSRGPTVHGLLKPEIVAPGYEIRSLVPAAHGIPENAFHLSGTSMASPHVAGVAAIVHAQNPEITPGDLRARLIGSAVPLAGGSRALSPSLQGSGRANAQAAATASVIASPDTLAFGQADGDGDPSASLELTLSNPSDAPVTAHLDVEPSAVSQGTLTLAGSDVTIAPGATATVAVTAQATVGTTDSELSGVIVARLGNGGEVRVPYLQLSRHLTVTATPEPSAGEVSLMVSSFLPLSGAPGLTIKRVDGEPFTVQTTPAASMPGWYKADVSTDEVGVYQVSATAESGDRTVTGTGTFEVIAEATSSATWQQLGRDASSAQLVVSPVAPGTAMQTTSTSVRPFVTTNHGETWSQVRSLPVADGGGKLIADAKSGTSFWYAVNGAIGNPPHDPSYNGKLLRTEDLGATWNLLPMPDKHISAITNSGEKFAAVVPDGVEISRDGGQSWDHVPYAWPWPITGATLHRGHMFVSGHTSVWQVGDVFGEARTPVEVHSRTMAEAFSGIAATEDVLAVSRNGGVDLSLDGGKSWKADTSFEAEAYTSGITALGNEFLMGGLEGYFRSTDAGKTWKSHPYPIYGVIAIDFDRWPDRRSSLLLPLELAGLYESNNDGKTFKRIGVSATTIERVIASTNEKGTPTVMVADDQGVGSKPLPTRSTLPTDATEWGATGGEAMIGVWATDLEQDPRSKGTLWRVRMDGTFAESMQQSVDAGKSWNVVGPLTYGMEIPDMDASPNVSGHVAAAFRTLRERGLLVTHDGWQHWETYSHPITIQSVTIDPHNESRIWLAATDGLYRSDDDGRTITRVFEGEVATVWVDPADANRVLAGGRGLWMSADGGATFTPADAGGADMYVSSFTSGQFSGKKGTRQTVLFAGSTTFRPGPFWVHGRGVLASRDGGKAWSNVSAGIGTTSVTDLDSSDDGKWLVAGTRQGGLYRANIEALMPLVK
jgi:subtilisin family serine protease